MFTFSPLSGKQVVISLEDTLVKVLYASRKRGSIVVDRTLLFEIDQLEAFLKEAGTKEVSLVKHFRDFHEETFSIPSVKKKFIPTLIETEIGKRFDTKDFSYTYSLSDVKIVEKRKVREVFAFAVRNDELREEVNRFHSHGISVKAIYPDIYALAEFVKPARDSTLCISEAGLTKTLFLIKGGEIRFIRTVESDQAGLDSFDIQNQ